MKDDPFESGCEHNETAEGFKAVDVQLAQFIEALVGDRNGFSVFLLPIVNSDEWLEEVIAVDERSPDGKDLLPETSDSA